MINEKKKIAILVSKPYKQQPIQDDLLLQHELQKHGYGVDIVAWDDNTLEFSHYAFAIIRSCWDYDQRLDEFLQQMEKIEKTTMLCNPFQIVQQNSDKRYLLELQARGIAITPTILADTAGSFSIPAEWKQIVIKPNISASGKDTYKYDSSETEKIKTVCTDIIRNGKIPLIQKYISSIETFGEHSSIIIDGQIVLTMKKIPAKGGFLIHKRFGGSAAPVRTSEEESAFVQTLLAKIDCIPLYMRADYLKDDQGGFILLELEQIEPHLYLAESRLGLETLTNGILKRIKM